jgi:hypothetical protein
MLHESCLNRIQMKIYCPVNAMLSRSVRIEHRYRLRQGDREEVSALVAIASPEGTQVL